VAESANPAPVVRAPARAALFRILAAPIAAIFVLLPPLMLFGGIYRGSLRKPSVLEGGIELLSLSLLLVASLRLLRDRRVALGAVAALSGLYLQLHQALLPALAALLLFEILVQVGGVARSLLRSEADSATLQDQLDCWVIGLAIWPACAVVASLLGVGGIPHLRVLLLALGALAVLWRRREPLIATVSRRFLRASPLEQTLALVLLVLLLLQFAKAAVVVDYDSNWYGLRPEKVLFGERSIFADLRLVHFVYHYSALLLEVLAAPVSGLGEYAFILAVDVGVLAVAMIVLYRFAREAGGSVRESLLLACLGASIPGVSNMASTAKGYVLGVLLGTLATLHFWRAVRAQQLAPALPGFVALTLMLFARLTSYLYFPLLLLGAALAWGSARLAGARPPLDVPPVDRRAALRLWAPVLLLSAADVVAFWIRTWRGTGMPTTPVLSKLWTALGFHYRYPTDALELQLPLGAHFRQASELFDLWYQLFFNPTDLEHVLISWPGNCGLLFLILSALSLLIRRPSWRETGLWLLVLPACAGSLLYATFGVFPHRAPGGDGNYYILPASLATVAGGLVLLRQTEKLAPLAAGLIAACTFWLLPLTLVGHWSWHPGTAPFSFHLLRTLPHTNRDWQEKVLQAGLGPLQEYARAHALKSCGGLTRLAAGDSTDMLARLLPCRFEDFEQLQGTYPGLFESDEAVFRLLRWKELDLLVLARKSLEFEARPLRRVFERLQEDPLVSTHESGPYLFLDLSKLTGMGAPNRGHDQ
jgi:hypothetical protein